MKLFKFLSRKKYHAIPLKKTKTHHLELRAKINGMKGKFILDTGASNTCIGLHLTDHFGLKPEATHHKAAGAGAVDIDTKVASGVTLEIGKWKADNWFLVLIDLTHVNTALEIHGAKTIQGVIGYDVLQKGKAVIDYQKKILYLKKNSRFST